MPEGWTRVAETSGNGWTRVGQPAAPSRPAGLPAGVNLPGFPASSASNLDVPSTKLSRLMGDSPTASLGVVGTHLKNLVATPYHAFKDAPRNADEAKISDGSTLGQAALGLQRLSPVEQSKGALKTAFQQAEKGNIAGEPYDTDGNYHPNAIQSLMDAIPIAGPLARSVENDAQKSGAIPALAGLGVDVGTPEAASGVLGKIKAAAPSLAEGALNIRPTARGYGKTPGAAILNETSGVRPATIEKQAQAALDQLTPSIEAMAQRHKGMVDITPARQVVQDAIDTAATRNNASGKTALQPVKEQLDTNLNNGLPLAPDQTAVGALNLKRGLRDAFVKNWSPDAASMLTRDTAKGASGALDSQLDLSLGPEFADTNQRISSLIPVVENAEKLTRADPLGQRLAGKLKAHTGALASAIGGAAAGAHAGGGLGAVAGGALGFALPEFLGAPATTMTMARAMDSAIPPALIPPLLSANIIAPKKEKK